MTKVLIIDDDVSICEMIVDYFDSYWPEANVNYTLDAKSGTDMLLDGHFDLVLIDGTLAGMDGPSMAVTAANQNTPFLYISGDFEFIAELAEMGLPYMLKPFALDILMEKSKQVMRDADRIITLGRRVRRDGA